MPKDPKQKPASWVFLTPERMHWRHWTRKRRNKFRKRFRRQHHCVFRFYSAPYLLAIKEAKSEYVEMLCEVR